MKQRWKKHRMGQDWKKHLFVALGPQLGALYFVISGGRSAPLPEFAAGAMFGLAVALLAVDFLPEEIRRRIQTGKCRG